MLVMDAGKAVEYGPPGKLLGDNASELATFGIKVPDVAPPLRTVSEESEADVINEETRATTITEATI